MLIKKIVPEALKSLFTTEKPFKWFVRLTWKPSRVFEHSKTIFGWFSIRRKFFRISFVFIYFCWLGLHKELTNYSEILRSSSNLNSSGSEEYATRSSLLMTEKPISKQECRPLKTHSFILIFANPNQ